MDITWDDFDRASRSSHDGAVSWRKLALEVSHRTINHNLTTESQNAEFAKVVKTAKLWMKSHQRDLERVSRARFVPGVGTEPATYRRR